MVCSKWLVGMLALTLGCDSTPDTIEFPEVAVAWGSASASLGAFDDSGVLRVKINEDVHNFFFGWVYFYGADEASSFMRGDLFDDLKESARTAMSPSIGSHFPDETPLFDGRKYWYNYGGCDLPIRRYTHGDADRLNREDLRIIQIKSLDKHFDSSGGYHNIGYIVVSIQYEDARGTDQVDCVILNRQGQKKLVKVVGVAK